jgi:hypothetical protein
MRCLVTGCAWLISERDDAARPVGDLERLSFDVVHGSAA